MVRKLSVHLLPELCSPEILRGGTTVVIDVLRASSTIVTALQHGATAVSPCGSPEEAQSICEQFEPGHVVLGGERGGVRIEGFDLGNSPSEYSASVIAGRLLAFTTTNGTRALLRSLSSRSILIGCFLNLAAIVSHLRGVAGDVHLVCAGTDGAVTGEDVLFAGAVSAELGYGRSSEWLPNDSTELAVRLYQSVAACDADVLTAIHRFLRETRGGRNLVALGFDADIWLCSQLSVTAVIPEFDQQDGQLKCAGRV